MLSSVQPLRSLRLLSNRELQSTDNTEVAQRRNRIVALFDTVDPGE